jgi:hypothetical protein
MPWLATALLAFASVAFGHAGFNHVMGTVAKISGNVLTVKTAKGNVDVKLRDRTEFTRNGQKAELTDVKPGTRVVAEVPEGSKDNLAQSVKIGAAPKTAAARQSHASHK